MGKVYAVRLELSLTPFHLSCRISVRLDSFVLYSRLFFKKFFTTVEDIES